MKRELIYSFTAFIAGVFTIIIAPMLSYPFKLLGLSQAAPTKTLEETLGRGGYVTTGVVPALPTILSMILISILIAGSCAFILKTRANRI